MPSVDRQTSYPVPPEVAAERADMHRVIGGESVCSQFLATVRHNCARDNVDYALIRTSMPLDAALTSFLKYRQRERRH